MEISVEPVQQMLTVQVVCGPRRPVQLILAGSNLRLFELPNVAQDPESAAVRRDRHLRRALVLSPAPVVFLGDLGWT